MENISPQETTVNEESDATQRNDAESEPAKEVTEAVSEMPTAVSETTDAADPQTQPATEANNFDVPTEDHSGQETVSVPETPAAENQEGQQQQQLETAETTEQSTQPQPVSTSSEAIAPAEQLQELPPTTEEQTPIEKSLSVEKVSDETGYTFTNTDPSKDPEATVTELGTSLSRPDSVVVVTAVPQLEVIGIDSPTHLSQSDLAQEPSQPIVDVNREECICKIKAALEVRDKLKLQNATLQNKLAEYFRKRRVEEAAANVTSPQQLDSGENDKSTSDQSQRYTNCLNSLRKLQKDHAALTQSNQTALNDLKTRLADKVAEAAARQEEYVAYRSQIVREAENSKTGKPLPAKVSLTSFQSFIFRLSSSWRWLRSEKTRKLFTFG